MRKRIFALLFVLLFAVILVACTEPVEETVLTEITLSGVENISLDFEEAFNIMTSVTALGDDGVDYTDQITFNTTAPVTAAGVLDTAVTGVHVVRYEVRIGEVLVQRFRNITVVAPERPEGLVVNGDFALGTVFWDDAANGLYNADGSSMTLSIDDGALKAEVVAGANFFTPRFGQQGIAFEEGKSYEVSFRAKASETKKVYLQVGELLSGAPYFVNFMTGQTEIRTITNEWDTYSFSFVMRLDNPRGGILFGLGTINDEAVDATVWFDDIDIKEIEPLTDTSAPIFSGISDETNTLVGSVFNPMAGVTAMDNFDGNVTAGITYEIYRKYGTAYGPVVAVDTTEEGVYRIFYSVTDEAGNVAFAEMTVNVIALIFKSGNLVVNPDFTTALDADEPEWAVWHQDWGTPPVVVNAINTVAGTYTLDITGGGDARWAVQFYQEGITLVEGTTYRVQFTVKAEVARSLSVAIGYGSPWVEYGRKDGIEITTTEGIYEFVFTVTKATYEDIKLVFELGSQPGFANGLVTFSNVQINELDVEPIVTNGDFSYLGWTAFSTFWIGSVATLDVNEAGEFVYNLTKFVPDGGASWNLQLIHNEKLVLKANTSYVFTLEARASEAIEILPFFTQGEPAGYNNIAPAGRLDLTTTKQTFTLNITTGASVTLPFEFKFEFGDQFTAAQIDEGAIFLIFDNLSLKEVGADKPELLTNGDATTVQDFYMYSETPGDSLTLIDGEAVVKVTALGNEPWQPHFYQMIDSLLPGTYTFKMVLTSSVTRDLRFNIVLPNADFASLLPEISPGVRAVDFRVVADVEKVVYITFTVATERTDVKLELDFGTLGGTLVSLPGEFTISEIMVYRIYE